MNTWNSENVRELYPRQALGFITNIGGQVRVNDPLVANAFRKLVTEDDADPQDPATLSRARAASEQPPQRFPYKQPTFGYIFQWLSELGKTTELDGLLEYAEAHLDPTWESGGLFYPRNDIWHNESGEWTHMDPYTGNGAIGYSRLNIPDGQKKMWDRPWTSKDLASRPWVEGVELSQDIDCLRGSWESNLEALVVTLRTWNNNKVAINLTARNLSAGFWAVYLNGKLLKCEEGESGLPGTANNRRWERGWILFFRGSSSLCS